ncbi:MAG: TonB-dependent receptor [Colwellia sp.]|nr:TonB-dependent receptor [Colwellia sp.]
MKRRRFTKTYLAKSLSLILGVGTLSPAFAEESSLVDENIEVIEVTGIRASMIKAMDIKREANGIVDAISAEDIGKFPDTNLAESLQRISGVSIDRSNNEGSKVTVRGFGPNFNLVTLNGREMPTAELAGTSAPQSRSFDFANIASESISGVEIHKTGKATNPSGGIGATINILTAKPLDSSGMRATLGVKAVMDTTNENGDDATPELSGLYSNTFADDTFGILVSGSFQKRDSLEQNAEVSGWDEASSSVFLGNNVTNNSLNPDGNVWIPQNYKYDVGDIERERTNGLVVLQYKPIETLTATLDYTYAKNETVSNRNHFGVWFTGGGAINSATINENGTVETIEENGGTYDFFTYLNKAESENKSLGFNLEWQATDNLNLNFDFHDSSAESFGGDTGNNTFFIMSAPVDSKTFDISQGTDIPTLDVNFIDITTDIAPNQIVANQAFANEGGSSTDITQSRFDGTWINEDDGGLASIEFGVGYVERESRSTFANTQYVFTPANDTFFNSSIFTKTGTTGLFTEFSGGVMPFFYDYDATEVFNLAQTAFPDGILPGSPDQDHTVIEKTSSAYVQFNIESEFNGMEVYIVAGMRYEQTDVEATSLAETALSIEWQNPVEFRTNFTSDGTNFTDVEADYALFLPSLDVSIEVVEDVLARFSYSKTVTRNSLQNMRGTTTITGTPKLGSRTASRGSPELLPYSSNNIDLSLEYYYGEASYVSLGYYSKDVDNFLVTSEVQEELLDLRDPANGQRSDEAIAQLTTEGTAASPTNVWERVLLNMGQPTDGTVTILADETDRPITWTTTASVNGESVSIEGFEFAIQHTFGDSGFGALFNMTTVTGDVSFDNATVGTQFTLPGLSDSANLVAFYEKDGIQARIAYNWRDDFLSAIGQSEGEANGPQYTEGYGQVDISASYSVNDDLTVFVEGLNITEETQRIHGRYEEQLLHARQYGARYNIGMRYNF